MIDIHVDVKAELAKLAAGVDVRCTFCGEVLSAHGRFDGRFSCYMINNRLGYYDEKSGLVSAVIYLSPEELVDRERLFARIKRQLGV